MRFNDSGLLKTDKRLKLSDKWQVAQNLTDKWYLRLVCLTDGWNDKC